MNTPTPAETILDLERCGVAQGDIARAIGVSQALVCMVKLGHRRLTRHDHVIALRALRRRYARRIAEARAQIGAGSE